jgi:hypothetical protein
MEEKDIKGQEKLKQLWNDAKRYQQTREEVRKSIHASKGMPRTIPFYRQRNFAIAASLLMLIGVSAILFFIIQRPFSDFRNGDLTHGNDTNLKLHMDKPDAKATQQIFSDEILLQWTERFDTLTHLVVLDARDGKILFRAEIKPGQQRFGLPKKTLKPGIYEWYIADKQFKRKLIIDN